MEHEKWVNKVLSNLLLKLIEYHTLSLFLAIVIY